MRKLLILMMGLATGVILAFVISQSQQPTPPAQTTGASLTRLIQRQPAASAQPFAELTIPYLRQEDFDSQLSELEIYSSNANYTSYLTSYTSQDGIHINGLLTIPQGEAPAEGWPAVVFVHGYIPPTQYQTTQRYEAYVDYLARNDLVVFKIDLRGHGESEGVAGGAYYSSGYIYDTLQARSALMTADFVHPEKVGLWGHSMAGNVVFRSAVVAEDIPAVAIWAGAVYTYEDFGQFGISDSSYQRPADDSPRRAERDELRALYGEFDSQNEFWQQVVPTNYLDDVTTSFQIHHARNDTTVPVEYSENAATVLTAAQIDHQLFLYNSGGHDLEGVTFGQAMERTVELFTQM